MGEGPVLANGEAQAFSGGARLLVPFLWVGVDLVGELFGAFHEDVHVASHGLVLLARLHFQGEVGDLVEVGLLVGVVDERGQGGQQGPFGLGPEPVVARLACACVGVVCVVHDVGDQAHDRRVGLVRVDVGERVEVRGVAQVGQVEEFDLISVVFQLFARLVVEFALGVGDGPVEIVVGQQVGQHVIVAFAGTG